MADARLPHVKEHNNTKICFADTLEQANEALKVRSELRNATELDKNINEASHLMLFGVESWTNGKEFAKMLAKSNFERVEIFGSTLDDQQQQTLAKGFDGDFNAKKLDLDNTELSAGGAKAIFGALKNSKVEELNLQGSIKDAATLTEILGNLVDSQFLKKIDLKINDIKGANSARDFEGFLAKFGRGFGPDYTFEMDLFYNDLQQVGAEGISRGLMEGNCRLTALDLCCNGIGDGGARALATALKTNRTLISLKLALNNIGNEGGIAIMDTLFAGEEPNVVLQVLDLSANVMKGTDVDEDELSVCLSKVINRAWGLLDFDFTGIELAEQGWHRVANAFRTAHVHFDSGRQAVAELLGEMSPIHLDQTRMLRFSIVDLMSNDNLAIMEEAIWAGGKKEQYYYIDWRRREEKAPDAK